MKTEIALIHTTPFVLEPIQKALGPLTDKNHFFHLMDEAVLIRMMKDGNTEELTVPWLTGLVENAVKGGAQGVIVSCSSLSPAVLPVNKISSVPVVRIDEALYRTVCANTKNPAVLMTNPTNEQPARLIAEETKDLLGLNTLPDFFVCREAFQALLDGKPAKHDELVRQEIAKILKDHDGIILSQISIERVRASLPETLRQRVHSSLDFIGRTIESMQI